MEPTGLLKIYDQEQRIEQEPPNTRREVSGRVIRHIMLQEGFGFIAYSDLDETSAAAAIEAQVSYFNDLGIGFEWKVYDHDRLARRGFEIEAPEALLVLDLASAADFLWSIPLPPVLRIQDAAGVEKIRRMEEDVWGDDHAWMMTRMVHELQTTPDLLSMFAILDGERVVSAAWMYYHPPTQFASLWGGSTLPDYRGRGYYTALLAARAREARDRGCRFLTVDASPMSRPILEKHGYQFLTYSRPCVWKRRKNDHPLAE